MRVSHLWFTVCPEQCAFDQTIAGRPSGDAASGSYNRTPAQVFAGLSYAHPSPLLMSSATLPTTISGDDHQGGVPPMHAPGKEGHSSHTPTPTPSGGPRRLSPGEISGIVIAAVAVALGVTVYFVLLRRCYLRRRGESSEKTAKSTLRGRHSRLSSRQFISPRRSPFSIDCRRRRWSQRTCAAYPARILQIRDCEGRASGITFRSTEDW